MTKMERDVKRMLRAGVFAVVLAAGVLFVMWLFDGGVTNNAIHRTLQTESSGVRELINRRADGMDARLEKIASGELALDAKLTRIEEKLDALLKLAAERQLPDGMQEAQ